MKLSVSAFRAQASAQRKILSSYQNQLNYGACTSFPSAGTYKFEKKPQMMVDSTGVNPGTTSKPQERLQCTENQEASDDPKAMGAEGKEKEAANEKRDESSASDKSPGRPRSKSNQRWMKLRTTVQLSGAISSTNQKSKPPLKREDSFLKRFSTRQIPETQETLDTGDEAETLNGFQTQNEINRRRRKRRKEMSKTVVNPDENFYFYWLMTVTVCVLYNLWTLIVRQSFPELQKAASAFWYSGDGFTDVVFACDIVVQFRTGYLEQGLMVYNSKKLASHYLKSRAFILDLLSLLPLDFLQLNIGVNPILRFPRFLKIYRVYNYYYMVESRTVYPNLWRVVNLIHILLILAHWFGCFYYLLSEAEGFQGDWVYPYRPGDYATLTRKYLGSLYWSTLTLTTIGDLPTPETNAESRGRSKAMTASGQSEGIPRRGHKSRLLQFNSNYGYIFTIISYLIGVFIFATIVGQVGNVITNRNANRLEFERLLDGAKTYMRHHKVPSGMKRRVLRWYDYSWSRGRIQGGGDINTALGLLPDKLKTELALHVNLSVLKKVTIFQECQPEFLHDLVLKMKAYIFTPGDLICRKGEVAREMFIIADGILDVISETGRVLTTMKAGDFFGEIGILNLDGLNKRTADVRSVGYSELFSLSREDVLTAMKDYPEAQEILQSLGRKRLMEAKSASKIYKAQGSVKQTKEHDSSGDSDSAGKRIVEKLRSDVKGLKNALRRSRRGTRTKETLEKAAENSGWKASSKKQSILRRMSHVQSSDEYEANNDVDQSPIGAGLPLLQRLKLLREKQEREREEKERSKSIVRSGNHPKRDESDGETPGIAVPFAQKLKLLKQKDSAALVVSSTVRTQVTGVRFDKSIFKSKSIGSPREAGTRASKEDADASSADSGIKERLKQIEVNQSENKTSPPRAPRFTEVLPGSDLAQETHSETSINVPICGGDDCSVPKLVKTKFEVPRTADAWKLLKNSSVSGSKRDKHFKNEGNQLIRRVSKKGVYLSKSDTVLEKQKSWEGNGKDKRSRSVSPSDSLREEAKELEKEKQRSRSVGQPHKANESGESSSSWETTDNRSRKQTGSDGKNLGGRRPEMKKYNSISDLSPEYSGLPFVKKLKILNERQKLEELEKELLVRSVSLDVPERPATKRGNVLVRSQSEASTVDFKSADAPHLEAELDARRQNLQSLVTCEDSFRKETQGPSQNPFECSVASPESNETLERKHLKSILKKLSAEDSTSDEDQSSRYLKSSATSKRRDNTEFRKLMRAPTVEGYAARHKKLTKSVTFDSDTLSSPPNTTPEQPPDDSRGKGFSPMSPTAILTLQLSNLSMIPIARPNKSDKRDKEEESDPDKVKSPDSGSTGHFLEKEQKTGALDKENLLMPYVLHELIEKNFRTLPFNESSEDEFFREIEARISLVFEEFLEEVQSKFQSKFAGLRIEVEKRDEIILQLHSKIRELEAKTKLLGVDGGADLGGSELQFQGNDSITINDFETLRRGVFSSSIESLEDVSGAEDSYGAVNQDLTFSPQKTDFLSNRDLLELPSGFLDNVAKYEENAFETEDKICLLPGRNEKIRGPNKSPELPSVEELELVEMPRSFRSSNFKGNRMEFHLVKDFSVDEAESEGREKPTESRPKERFINRVAQIQRAFSCTQERAGGFVALDIDDSSNSSDPENLHNKDWEVQMLVEELAKKDPDWVTAERKRNSVTHPEHAKDVEELQEEVDRLKRMVCTGDLTRLSSSELDILESIIEAKDEKISELARSNSLVDGDDSDGSKKKKRHARGSFAQDSDGKLKCERRKKTSLRQKIGKALSFDFQDIEREKSSDSVKHRSFCLRKQKTISCSPQEHQSLYTLWHTSSRLRNRVLEDYGRAIKSITIKSSTKDNAGSSLPILTPGFLPLETNRHARSSLPTLSAKELWTNVTPRLNSSRGCSEETHQGGDSGCEESEMSSETNQSERPSVTSPSPSGLVRSNDCYASSSLNSFIKSMGLKVKQVMAGESNCVRSQVPTISKLCDERLTSTTGSAGSPDNLEDMAGATPETDVRPMGNNLAKTPEPFNRDSKTDPPDL